MHMIEKIYNKIKAPTLSNKIKTEGPSCTIFIQENFLCNLILD